MRPVGWERHQLFKKRAYNLRGLDTFALATLWLIPLFGYVVLLVNAGILVSLVLAALEERTSYIRPLERYRHYEVFSDADWALLGFSLLALGYLSWLAWQAVRGRLLSRLMRDQDDQTGSGE